MGIVSCVVLNCVPLLIVKSHFMGMTITYSLMYSFIHILISSFCMTLKFSLQWGRNLSLFKLGAVRSKECLRQMDLTRFKLKSKWIWPNSKCKRFNFQNECLSKEVAIDGKIILDDNPVCQSSSEFNFSFSWNKISIQTTETDIRFPAIKMTFTRRHASYFEAHFVLNKKESNIMSPKGSFIFKMWGCHLPIAFLHLFSYLPHTCTKKINFIVSKMPKALLCKKTWDFYLMFIEFLIFVKLQYMH